MARQTLPGQLADATAPFLHSFQKEMNEFLERFNKGTGLAGAEDFITPLLPAIDIAETDEMIAGPEG